jgi:hypothetical protein
MSYAADLQQVAKAIGRDQAGADIAMLNERVGSDRGAMAEISNL